MTDNATEDRVTAFGQAVLEEVLLVAAKQTDSRRTFARAEVRFAVTVAEDGRELVITLERSSEPPVGIVLEYPFD
jgi:hypothetical protein